MAAVSAERGSGFEDHVIAELHALQVQLAEFKQLLDLYRPLLDRFASTNGGTVGLLRARRGLQNGRT